MPDKYDEVVPIGYADEFRKVIQDFICDSLTNGGYVKDDGTHTAWIDAGDLDEALWEHDKALRSAFPPPAEDARQVLERMYFNACEPLPTGAKLAIMLDVLSAGIERFAESRVEPWREALVDMIDYAEDAYSDYCAKMGDYRKASQEGMRREIDKARALLSGSPAKEATK